MLMWLCLAPRYLYLSLTFVLNKVRQILTEVTEFERAKGEANQYQVYAYGLDVRLLGLNKSHVSEVSLVFGSTSRVHLKIDPSVVRLQEESRTTF